MVNINDQLQRRSARKRKTPARFRESNRPYVRPKRRRRKAQPLPEMAPVQEESEDFEYRPDKAEENSDDHMLSGDTEHADCASNKNQQESTTSTARVERTERTSGTKRRSSASSAVRRDSVPSMRPRKGTRSPREDNEQSHGDRQENGGANNGDSSSDSSSKGNRVEQRVRESQEGDDENDDSSSNDGRVRRKRRPQENDENASGESPGDNNKNYSGEDSKDSDSSSGDDNERSSSDQQGEGPNPQANHPSNPTTGSPVPSSAPPPGSQPQSSAPEKGPGGMFPGQLYNGPLEILLPKGRITRSSASSANVTTTTPVTTAIPRPCDDDACTKLVNVGKWGRMGCGSTVCVHCGLKRKGDWEGVRYGFMGNEDLVRHLKSTQCMKARGFATRKQSAKQLLGEYVLYKINNPERSVIQKQGSQEKRMYKCYVCNNLVGYRSRYNHHLNANHERHIRSASQGG